MCTKQEKPRKNQKKMRHIIVDTFKKSEKKKEVLHKRIAKIKPILFFNFLIFACFQNIRKKFSDFSAHSKNQKIVLTKII